jgi:CubicO group peptidase (beta-lactamase class C family)
LKLPNRVKINFTTMIKLMKKNVLVVLLCAFFQPGLVAQNPTPSFVKDSLDAYVQKALTNWQIPGAAVCVVKDGKVVAMKSYGVKNGAAPIR